MIKVRSFVGEEMGTVKAILHTEILYKLRWVTSLDVHWIYKVKSNVGVEISMVKHSPLQVPTKAYMQVLGRRVQLIMKEKQHVGGK